MLNKNYSWSSHHGAAETNLTRNHEIVGSILALFSGLRIQWCRSQSRLGSGIAVALAEAGSFSSNLARNLHIPGGGGAVLKRKKKKKKKKELFLKFIKVTLSVALQLTIYKVI